jgi:hypothetical protein
MSPSFSEAVILYNVALGEPVFTYTLPQVAEFVKWLSFSPDGTKLTAISSNFSKRVWTGGSRTTESKKPD